MRRASAGLHGPPRTVCDTDRGPVGRRRPPLAPRFSLPQGAAAIARAAAAAAAAPAAAPAVGERRSREQWEAENAAADDLYDARMLEEFQADSLQWEAGWDSPAAWVAALPTSGATVGQDMDKLHKMSEKVARVNRMYNKTVGKHAAKWGD